MCYRYKMKEKYKKGNAHNTKLKMPDVVSDKCTGCATWQQQSCTYHLPYCSCSTRATHKSLTLNKTHLWVWVFCKNSQENGPLALLPAPECLHPSFYSDQCVPLNFSSYLGCPSTTFSLAIFTLRLATVQNWMLVALEKASLHFVNSLQLSPEGLPYLHLTTGS